MWILKTYVFCKGQNSQKPIHFIKEFKIPPVYAYKKPGATTSANSNPDICGHLESLAKNELCIVFFRFPEGLEWTLWSVVEVRGAVPKSS